MSRVRRPRSALPFRTEMPLPELPGYLLRARKAVTSMGMALPRYIHPDPRDYFYLTLKPGLTGTALPGQAIFSSSRLAPRGLAAGVRAGFPGQRAHAAHRSGARRAQCGAAPAGASWCWPSCAARRPSPSSTTTCCTSRRRPGGASSAVGVPPQTADVLMRAPQLRADSVAQAALGVDPSGLLLYVETDDSKPGVLFEALSGRGGHVGPLAVRATRGWVCTFARGSWASMDIRACGTPPLSST